MTVALFDDQLDIPFDRIDLADVPEMDREIYFTRGCTALYDAVGTMIRRTVSHRRHLSPAETPKRTVFVITTDGMENASREFSGPALRRLIEQRQEDGWEFLYLGANIDAAVEAERIGIQRSRSVQFHADSEGIYHNFEAVSRTVSGFACAAPIDDSWADEIRQDFKSRKSKR